MIRILNWHQIYKSVLIATLSAIWSVGSCFAAVGEDSANIAPINKNASDPMPYVLGSGSAHVNPNTFTVIGQTSATAGLCTAPLAPNLVTSVTGIDGAGGGCNDKFINLGFTAQNGVLGFGNLKYYIIQGSGVVNSNSGCGASGDYLGFTVSWVLTCQ